MERTDLLRKVGMAVAENVPLNEMSDAIHHALHGGHCVGESLPLILSRIGDNPYDTVTIARLR